MIGTLVEDEELEPREETWCIRGRKGFTMQLTEEVVMQLVKIGAIRWTQDSSGPGYIAHIYDSIDSGRAS